MFMISLKKSIICFTLIASSFPAMSDPLPLSQNHLSASLTQKGSHQKLHSSKKKNPIAISLKKALKKNKIPTQQLGVIIASKKETLYQLNAHKDFIPASLVKIFTASALLDSLSPSLKFTTQFLAKKKIHNSTLKADLYLKGGGDPGFVSESLWNLVNNLKRTGLKTVEGNLVVDNHYFDKERKGARLAYPSHSSYDAPIGALSFNWNTANIYIRPGKIDQPLKIVIDPSDRYFSSVENKTKTVKGKKKKNIFISRKKDSRESLIIKGHLSAHHPETLIYRNILFPEIWTGWNAIEFLKQRGINITGQVKTGSTPKQALLLAKWESRPLTEYIKLMMKYSNNFMVEMLVKNMIIKLKGKKGSLKEGLEIIKQHIQKLGISPREYQLIQASGLSRKNKVKPKQLLEVLKYWLTHPLQPEFESAFPIAGRDGTLKKYFSNKNLTDRVHAKTGSISGVTGLAGYLTTKTKEKIIFVFLFNGPPNSTKKAEKLFQQWIQIVQDI